MDGEEGVSDWTFSLDNGKEATGIGVHNLEYEDKLHLSYRCLRSSCLRNR